MGRDSIGKRPGGAAYDTAGIWVAGGGEAVTLRPMSELDLGTQPLDGLMEAWGLSNHDLVDASPEQLTHKQVQRARKGRRLTLAMMMKVTRSLNIAVWYRLTKEERETYFEYFHKHLFDYAKGYDPAFEDPNGGLMTAVKSRGGKILSREE